MSVEELAQWRASGREFVLLDVRESYEVARAALPGALHIPMRDLPQRINELQSDADIAVLCHHGHRSDAVARFLQTQGFERARNVAGGIDAYAERIDPQIPRY
ncbi:MAG TPA: rhodanese-like domain-containing protein [Candidatus Baltobacteraceae bacterium]|jgi:rhodanese-related sulfurtransferase|nr:rhodanese-like domain-containing protein [Candidatus Baltobacteraceae bacterium]